MNPRIAELWDQAAKSTKDDSWESQSAFIETFSELIVRDCARLVEDSKWNLPRGCTAADQAKYVKDHFGVEE